MFSLYERRHYVGVMPSEFFPDNIQKIDLNRINRRTVNEIKYIETEGILVKVERVKDLEQEGYICPKCKSRVSGRGTYLKLHTDSPHFPYQRDEYPICTKCTPIEEDEKGCCTNFDELQELNDKIFYVSIQSLLIKDADTGKTLLVEYVFDENDSPFSKKDLNCLINVKGRIMWSEGQYKMATDSVKKVVPLNDEEEIIQTGSEVRDIPGYDEWRETIVSRDQKCVCCNGDKHLQAHHLYGYKEYPQLRVDTNNGVTLCKFCHEKYHSYMGLKEITPDKFIQFMKRFMIR